MSITVKGDALVEGNETFFVNLSRATNGATFADSQGQGTILNDDGVTAITTSHGLNGAAAASSSDTGSSPVALFQGPDSSHDWNSFWHDRTDWTHNWLRDHPTTNPPTNDDHEDNNNTCNSDGLLALISRWEDQLHQFLDTLTQTPPPNASQWIDRLEQAFHFDLH